MATQNGSPKKNGVFGVHGPFPSPAVVVTVSGGLRGAHSLPYDATSGFGKCSCGIRLYRKHRIASSLLRLINQALNTSIPLLGRKPAVGGTLRISCPKCGNTLEVVLAVSRPTTGPRASMSIVLSMQRKTTAFTSLDNGANMVQTMMDDLTDDNAWA